jgi:hypothetical protein
VEKHHRAEVGDEITEAERRNCVECGDDTEGRQNLEVVVVLEDEREVCSLGADTEV